PLVERLDRRLAATATVDAEPADIVLAGPVASTEAPVTAITIAPGVARGIGVGRAHGAGRSSITYVVPRAIRRSRGADVMAVGGGDWVVRQRPRFSLVGTLRSLRNHTPAWWVRAAGIVWLLGALGIFGRF